ncbi:hypothetical protein [Spirosoma agri]|uniref:Uncharacterized protein n=1 Tax=Spirosoma agri TaxID=1987381 RepID=A0A6M0ID45_9BACT|nr:hypothetical protein [Spirosoma agri]NEU66216.1 hypothetical protein [Spirosoma agri]
MFCTKVKKGLVTVLMVLTWLIMFGTLIGAPSLKGKIAIVSTALLINGMLAIYYSCLNRRPANLKEWFRM